MKASFDGKSDAFYLQDMAMNNILPHAHIEGIDKLMIYSLGHNALKNWKCTLKTIFSVLFRFSTIMTGVFSAFSHVTYGIIQVTNKYSFLFP